MQVRAVPMFEEIERIVGSLWRAHKDGPASSTVVGVMFLLRSVLILAYNLVSGRRCSYY